MTSKSKKKNKATSVNATVNRKTDLFSNFRNLFLIIIFLLISGTQFSTWANNDKRELETIASDTLNPVGYTRSNSHHFFTFAKAYFGKLTLTLNSDRQQTIRVAIGEKKMENNRVDVNPPGCIRYFIDSLTLKKGRHQYSVNLPVFRRHNSIPTQKHVGNITPFRYAEIDGYDGTIAIEDVKQIAFFANFDNKTSTCKTSSLELDMVWELCKHTIKATSCFGIYVDGDRERRPYEADAYINQLTHYAVDNKYIVARQTIDHLAKHPTWPSEWLHHMPMMLWADYQYTGKKDYLEKHYKHYLNQILNLPLDTNGLVINKKNNDIIDWPKSERDGYQILKVNNVPNAFYYNSLKTLAQIAAVLKQKDDVKMLTQKAEQVKQTFNNIFWDKQTGLYIDAIGSTHTAHHAVFFPIALGLANEQQIESCKPFIRKKGMATSVYGAQYLLEALYMIDMPQFAFQLITTKGNRGWVNMIANNSTITWEAWSHKVKNNYDWNHAWGTAPGNIIARQIFGIKPHKPGFEIAKIQPHFSGLTQGKYTHPTINGNITVEYNKLNRDNSTIDIEVAMPAILILPTNMFDHQNVYANSKRIRTDKKQQQIIIKLKKGKHHINLKNKISE